MCYCYKIHTRGLSDQKTHSAFLKLSLRGCNVNVSILENVCLCFMGSPWRFVSVLTAHMILPSGEAPD